MIKFIKAYFSDVWHLMTCRQTVPLRVGTSWAAYLVCTIPAVLYPLADSLLGVRWGHPATGVGTAVSVTVMTMLAIFGWFVYRGPSIATSLIYFWAGVLTWLVLAAGTPMWIAAIISIISMVVPILRNKSNIDQPAPN